MRRKAALISIAVVTTSCVVRVNNVTEDLTLTGLVAAHIHGSVHDESCHNAPRLSGPSFDMHWTSESGDGTPYNFRITVAGGGKSPYTVPQDRGAPIDVAVTSAAHRSIGSGAPHGTLTVAALRRGGYGGNVDVDLGAGEHLRGKWACAVP